MDTLVKREEGSGPLTSLELRPETVKAYRDELRRARIDASLPKQDELAYLAISTCYDILSGMKTSCRCDRNYGKNVRSDGLCQSCKRVHWALTMVVELEKVINERLKIDAGLLKLSAERVSGANDRGSDEGTAAVELIRAAQHEAERRAHETRRALKPVDATICKPPLSNEEPVIDDPPDAHLRLTAIAQ